MPWTLREHQAEPDRLAHLLYWQQLLEPASGAPGDVVYQNDHSLMSVFRYRGPDMESADAHELMALHARLHAVILTLPAGWVLHAEARRWDAAAYPPRIWSHPIATLVDEERRAQFGTPGSHFETTYHLTLTWHIPRTLGSWWHRLWWENIPTGHAQTSMVTHFREEVARVLGQLQSILPACELLTEDALCTYLKNTVSAFPQELVGTPNPPWYLNYQLTDSVLHPGVIPQLDEQWLRVILIKNERRQIGFPATTYPGILDILHDLPLEYRYVERWIVLSHAKAHKELSDLEDLAIGQRQSVKTQTRERLTGTPSTKVEQVADQDAFSLSEARGLLDAGVITFGYLTLAVVVWDADFTRVEAKKDAVILALRAKGFLASAEKIDSVGAYLGTIPGDSYHNVERPMLHSQNVVHLMPTTSVWSGPPSVPHLKGGPLLCATTRGHTPFWLTTHEGDVGDFFLCSPKGSGKSTHLALMAMQWTQYRHPAPARVVALDKGGSLKAATLAMDGQWVDLAPMTARPLQPLARIHDPEERAWAVEWIEDLLVLEGMRREPTLSREIRGAMDALAPFPTPHRTLSGFCGLVQSSQVREALGRYTEDGSLLDGDEDWLEVGQWTCFEMETLLDDFPRLVHPVAKVLFRRVETALDGAPTFLSLDECHAYFAVETLATRLLGWLKTMRRKNTLLGFATQNLLDFQRSPVGFEVIQACPTRIYGANPHALEPGTMALYQEMGLTPRQCQLIAHAVPAREFYYQGQQGNRLYRLDLGKIALSFCGQSRTPDLRDIAKVHSESPHSFAESWLRFKGLHEEANLLKEAFDAEKEESMLRQSRYVNWTDVSPINNRKDHENCQRDTGKLSMSMWE
jgi:type IV secretion system protein TrbE